MGPKAEMAGATVLAYVPHVFKRQFWRTFSRLRWLTRVYLMVIFHQVNFCRDASFCPQKPVSGTHIPAFFTCIRS
jgi:hypothetical protein